jgi:hypothetical protein
MVDDTPSLLQIHKRDPVVLRIKPAVHPAVIMCLGFLALRPLLFSVLVRPVQKIKKSKKRE